MKNTEHIVNVYDRNENIIGKITEHRGAQDEHSLPDIRERERNSDTKK